MSTRRHRTRGGNNSVVKRIECSAVVVRRLWEVARAGDFRAGAAQARDALVSLRLGERSEYRVELHLIVAFCVMRQGQLSDAHHELDTASRLAASLDSGTKLAAR